MTGNATTPATCAVVPRRARPSRVGSGEKRGTT
ncbi:hypothetical protein STVIR_0007 [Streptomyces viridochromogenes Tue57]|uniref:Uncharacterized protein n=1 Tax=Streptomyces viridochromogenes Tue57 TaxID=1160705 RepID=L8PSN0_STRVR|nr:hypothetical protein STVIR_0007 [Streptomyces viridochromogenes Tue57]